MIYIYMIIYCNMYIHIIFHNIALPLNGCDSSGKTLYDHGNQLLSLLCPLRWKDVLLIHDRSPYTFRMESTYSWIAAPKRGHIYLWTRIWLQAKVAKTGLKQPNNMIHGFVFREKMEGLLFSIALRPHLHLCWSYHIISIFENLVLRKFQYGPSQIDMLLIIYVRL